MGIALALEALVVIVGGTVFALVDDLRWLTVPALSTPPLALLAGLLWPPR